MRGNMHGSNIEPNDELGLLIIETLARWMRK